MTICSITIAAIAIIIVLLLIIWYFIKSNQKRIDQNINRVTIIDDREDVEGKWVNRSNGQIIINSDKKSLRYNAVVLDSFKEVKSIWFHEGHHYSKGPKVRKISYINQSDGSLIINGFWSNDDYIPLSNYHLEKILAEHMHIRVKYIDGSKLILRIKRSY